MKTIQENHLTWFNRGKLLIKLGQLESALDCFDRAIAMKENFYAAWSEKGYILDKLKRFAEADFCFDKSLGVVCGAINWDMEDDQYFMIY